MMMDGPLPENLNEYMGRFLESEDQRPSGRDVYQDVFDDPVIFPLQRPRETAMMIAEARKINPRIVFEIGADKGGGLYHWCKCLPTVQRVIACEIRGVPYRELFNDAFPDLEFLWMAESSYAGSTMKYVEHWLRPQRIDCLFIDGDKAMFETDFDAYLPLMNPNGIVFMHDINDRPPREAYDRVCARGYQHQEIIDIQDATDAMDREYAGIPSKGAHEGWLRHWKGRSCGVGVIYIGDKP